MAAPEMSRVRRLIERAGRGLAFSAARLPRVVEKLTALPQLQGLPALVQLLALLDELAGARARLLATESYAPRLDLQAESRLARAYAFMLGRFRNPITLEQIARAASMTPAAFSRFFKRSTGRNVSVVLNELRVGHAAQQLQTHDFGVAEIAYASGFPTLSNFNRRFREQMGRSPKEFRSALRNASVAVE
ncbi:helix-turn-helix transcriptional regulator [Oleiharenicola lentus]|uniref:helix-turn-helix transcriptional regulator n=1 Tax=Oleiharenicola lentus TaxID=2508720 RepID=UPI003F67EE4F